MRLGREPLRVAQHGGVGECQREAERLQRRAKPHSDGARGLPRRRVIHASQVVAEGELSEVGEGRDEFGERCLGGNDDFPELKTRRALRQDVAEQSQLERGVLRDARELERLDGLHLLAHSLERVTHVGGVINATKVNRKMLNVSCKSRIRLQERLRETQLRRCQTCSTEDMPLRASDPRPAYQAARSQSVTIIAAIVDDGFAEF